jgi:ABC-type molybdate transport system permease subunit
MCNLNLGINGATWTTLFESCMPLPPSLALRPENTLEQSLIDPTIFLPMVLIYRSIFLGTLTVLAPMHQREHII